MSETIPQSQRRHVEAALIVAQQLLIDHLKRAKWKQTKDVTDRLEQAVAYWLKFRDMLDTEYGAPGIAASPFKDEHGVTRPHEWFQGLRYYTPPPGHELPEALEHPEGARS